MVRDWLAQRVTAVAMAAYTVFMAAAVAGAAPGFEGWRALMANGFVRFSTLLFVACLCGHAWLGMRDVWMDYVKPAGLRRALNGLTALVLMGDAGWAARVLWSLP